MFPMIPIGLLTLIYLALLVQLYRARNQLPERVAAHFLADGRPDGWHSRRAYLVIMTFMGGWIWLAGVASALYLLYRGLRPHAELLPLAACLPVALIFGVHRLTVMGNQHVPPQLPMKSFWIQLGFVGMGLAIWLCAIFWAFPPATH